MPTPYPASWYAADIGRADPFPALETDGSADACIVGGGLAGLTTALELTRAGRSIMLLEDKRIGFGASGRNGGFVGPGFALSNAKIAQKTGAETARRLYELSVSGAEYVRATIASLDPKLKMGDGWLYMMRYPDHKELDAEHALLTEYGTRVEIWDGARTRAVAKSARYHHGLFFPDGFHIQPLAYSLALAREIRRLGGKVYEESGVTSWERSGPSIRVRTAAGSVTARDVVFATGGYEKGVFGPLAHAVLPVATYIAVTERLGNKIDTAIATNAALMDTRRAGDYYRRLPDGRILWGGRITARRSEPARLGEMMRRDMLSVYPQLGSPRMDYAWSGLMGYARHKMPVIGRVESGLWMASAFGGIGLNTTAMGGQMIARAIVSGNEDWRLLEKFGAPWIGGPFGQAAAQLHYWGLQVQDRMDERPGSLKHP